MDVREGTAKAGKTRKETKEEKSSRGIGEMYTREKKGVLKLRCELRIRSNRKV